MSQTWVTNVYDSSHVADTDLGNMSDMFETLKSNFSGASAPTSPLAGQTWYDSDDYIMRMRLAAGTWIGLMHGDTSQKIWVYRNTAMDGWAIDAGVSDVVTVLKGGSTYVTGGTTAGGWTISGLTHSHTVNSHNHVVKSEVIGVTTSYAGPPGGWDSGSSNVLCVTGVLTHNHTGSTENTSPTTTSSGASDGNWRISGAVGTLQYLDL